MALLEASHISAFAAGAGKGSGPWAVAASTTPARWAAYLSLAVGLHAAAFVVSACALWERAELADAHDSPIVAEVIFDSECAEYVPETAGYRGPSGGSNGGDEGGRPAPAPGLETSVGAPALKLEAPESLPAPHTSMDASEAETPDGMIVRPVIANVPPRAIRSAGRLASGEVSDAPLAAGTLVGGTGTGGTGLGGMSGGNGKGAGGTGGGGGTGTGSGVGNGTGKGKGTGNGKGDGWDALSNAFGKAEGGRATLQLPGKPDYPHACRSGTCKGGIACQGVGRWRILAEKAGAPPTRVEMLKSAGCALLDASTRKYLMKTIISDAGTFEVNIRFEIEGE